MNAYGLLLARQMSLTLADEDVRTTSARCWQVHIHGHDRVCTSIDIRCSNGKGVRTEHGRDARDVPLIRTADAGQGETSGQCTAHPAQRIATSGFGSCSPIPQEVRLIFSAYTLPFL